jgi:hypothetical protein
MADCASRARGTRLPTRMANPAGSWCYTTARVSRFGERWGAEPEPMIGQGEHADTLRALGRFLELVGATQIAVSERDDHVAVMWRTGPGREERHFSRTDVGVLRASARLFRGTGGRKPSFGMTEFLRIIGGHLDGVSARRISVVGTSDGLWASGRVEDDADFSQKYTYSELIAHAQAFY